MRALRGARASATAERLPQAALVERQRVRLGELVRFAAAHSPVYADLYRGLDLSGPIDPAMLPPVAKAHLMDRFDDWVTDRRLRLAEIERHLETLAGDALHLGTYRVCATGGTSGRRGVFVFSRAEWTTVMAGFLRHTAFTGMQPRVPRLRIAAVMAAHPLHMTARLGMSLDVGLHVMRRLDARRPVRDLARELEAFQPHSLSGYPSVLALLADEQLAGRLHIAPQCVVTTSETRTPEMEARIVAAWGQPPFDVYASTEVGLMAIDCDRHVGRHIIEDFVLIENVDADGQPVPDGQPGARLLVTNLWNDTQPVIRYELSDIATIASDRCACGRTLRRIVAIDGRSDDVLRMRGRDGAEVAVHPLAIRSPFAALAEIRQYQVVYDGAQLLIRVVPAEGAAAEAIPPRVREALAAKLSALGVVVPPITVLLTEALGRGDGHSGKLKLIEVRAPGAAAADEPAAVCG